MSSGIYDVPSRSVLVIEIYAYHPRTDRKIKSIFILSQCSTDTICCLNTSLQFILFRPLRHKNHYFPHSFSSSSSHTLDHSTSFRWLAAYIRDKLTERAMSRRQKIQSSQLLQCPTPLLRYTSRQEH